MCKITRNARSGALTVRQQPHSHTDQNHAQSNARVHTPIEYHGIHGKDDLEQIDEKLAVLPTHNQKKNENIDQIHSDIQLHDEMVVETKQNTKKDGSSSSSTAAACRPNTSTVVNQNAEAETANASASLRAIAALCLPEQPKVIPGTIIRECLLGQVSLGSYSLGNNQFLPVVVKEFQLAQVLNKTTKNGQHLNEDALAELQIHAYIQKRQITNVIGLYAMHLSLPTNKLFAYLEYAAKGELFSLLQARASPMPFMVACNFFVQLLQGVNALHSINVVHRDISLENVLLTADNQVKICDFGLATICAPGVNINDGRAVGKVKYMCPEVYYGEEYDARLADVWSSAVVFFLLLTNVFPYERPSVEDPRLVMLCHGQINQLLAHWQRPALGEELLELFSHMFCPPQERWTAAQLLQLPFCQRFANVSKADIENALEPRPSANQKITMSTEQCSPAVRENIQSKSPVSVQVEAPASRDVSNSLSEWSSHSHCHTELLPNCPLQSFSDSLSGSTQSAPNACLACALPHSHSEPCLAQQQQQPEMDAQQFATPAVIADGRFISSE